MDSFLIVALVTARNDKNFKQKEMTLIAQTLEGLCPADKTVLFPPLEGSGEASVIGRYEAVAEATSLSVVLFGCKEKKRYLDARAINDARAQAYTLI
jgi:hypothetical protein